MNRLKTITLSLMSLVVVVFSFVAMSPAPVSAANIKNTNECIPPTILTFPVWYRGVAYGQDCEVRLDKPTDAWVIVLNIFEILMQLAIYLSSVYIIWGGFKYLTSQGSPDGISKAGSTVLNASIGLIIALIAVAIVRFVSERIG